MKMLRSLFEDSGALLFGHFRLSSGLHSGQYFQCALLLSWPEQAQRLGGELAKALPPSGEAPELVVSPALGGIVIGQEAAKALGVRAFFAERGPEGALLLRRGFSLKPGEKVLVVEDVITTGKSTAETLSLVRSLGGRPVGAACVVLRSGVPPELGVPLTRLAHLPAESFPPEDCPLCKKGLPLVKPGSRPEKRG